MILGGGITLTALYGARFIFFFLFFLTPSILLVEIKEEKKKSGRKYEGVISEGALNAPQSFCAWAQLQGPGLEGQEPRGAHGNGLWEREGTGKGWDGMDFHRQMLLLHPREGHTKSWLQGG